MRKTKNKKKVKSKSIRKTGFLRDRIKKLEESVSKYRRLTDTLRTKEENLDNIVKKIADAIIVVDKKGIIRFVNPAAEALFGRKSEQLKDKLFKIPLVAGEERRLEIVGKDGGVIQAEMRVTEIKRRKNPIYIASIRDIAAILRSEQLEAEINERKRIDQIKDELVSTVSHEFRTPLSITKEGICLVLDKIAGPINVKQKQILTTSRDNIDRLTRIINNLLDISKIEAGRESLRRELVNITDLIKHLVASFEYKAKNKGLEIRIDDPQKEINLYIDPDKISRVFINLIDNAVKFTAKGFIEISVKELKDEVLCTVSDTGIGISQNNLHKVFEKFQQFGRTAGAGEKGTGLGLSIAKKLVQMHKGKIWVESEPGKGTKFIFSMPRYTSAMIFKEYINEAIQATLKKDSKMSLIVVSIAKFDELVNKFPRERIRSILKDLESVLKNSLRREGDVVVKDTGEVIILLVDCTKESALVVEGRLKESLESYLVEKNLSDVIQFRLGCSTYPDEAKSDEELMHKARHGKKLSYSFPDTT